jgi:signal transduction histidine kinase
MLHDFLKTHRTDIIARTRVKVAARPVPSPTAAELSQGIPIFLDQLIGTLEEPGSGDDAMTASAARQGDDMFRLGFTVGQVVHGYGDVCQAVTELAFETDAPITVDEFRTLNRCLDDAIATAVTEFGQLHELALMDQGTERLGVLAHEFRNRLNTAQLAFTILKGGKVPIGGSTGALLERSLTGLAQLLDGALAEVRLESAPHHREVISLATFIDEVQVAAMIQATVRTQQLTVDPVPDQVTISADRQLLATAVGNLLQNAFTFTPPHGHIRLRTRATAGRVFIEIEDECGGLGPGLADTLLSRVHQHGRDRVGSGLGLMISQKAVELHGGTIRIVNHPGKGCTFVIELPRRGSS